MSPRIALVTGATSGFGEAIAERFLTEGWRVVATGRRGDRLKRFEKHGERFLPLVFDIRDRAATEAAVRGLPPDFAAIDLLVNNAGLALGLEPAHRTSLDEWETMLDTNCRGLVTITRAILPGMVERKRGHVVNIGSIAATVAYPGGNVYGATKAFVHQFTRNLRADLVGTGVRATVIEPGMAETEFSLVRFQGDAEKAKTVYAGVKPLVGADIAEVVHWVATLPPHVNVTALELTPEQQGFGPLAVVRR